MAADSLRTWRFRTTGVVLEVHDLPLACCAVETTSAFASRPDLFEEVTVPIANAIRVLLVSGTVTDRLLPAVMEAARGLGPDVKVVSFGSCANTGGPYWDSYSVTKGIDQFLPVARYVPGCAPPPEALVSALLDLVGQSS